MNMMDPWSTHGCVDAVMECAGNVVVPHISRTFRPGGTVRFYSRDSLLVGRLGHEIATTVIEAVLPMHGVLVLRDRLPDGVKVGTVIWMDEA